MLRRSPVTSGAGTETTRPDPPPEPASSPAPPPPRPSVTLPKRVWRAISVFGLFLVVTLSVLPVGARFGDDPLLRLRELNPELSPPSPTAECGAAVGSLDVQPLDTSLFEVARARACERAARRRVYGSVAAGAILVMIGLLGTRGGIPSPARLRPN